MKKKLAHFVVEKLRETFPDAQIELDYDHDDPWQLLVVVSLSAQTTDKKVNQISRNLFARFKTAKDFAEADPKEIEPYIKSIGLYRNKARNLVLAARKLMNDYDGVVPQERRLLEDFAGVGKKTSAVIVANAFNIPAIAVDTHVMRVSRRLGLTDATDPNKIESELSLLFEKEDFLDVHHMLILHGRRICVAKKPHCSVCPLAKKCPRLGVTVSD